MNQLKVGVILSYISMVISSIIALCYTPIMLRILGQSEYGLYQLAVTTVSYLGLLKFGIGTAYIRYYMKYKVNNDENAIAKLNGMYLVVYSVMGIIAFITGAVLVMNIDVIFESSLQTGEIDVVKKLMLPLVFYIAISFPASTLWSYITANERYIFHKVVQIIKALLNPFIVLPLLLMGYKSMALVIVTILFSLCTNVAYIIYCRRLGMKIICREFDKKLFREIIVFSTFVFINIIVNQINWSVDKFLLGVYCGTTAVAVYAIAAQINTYYMSFSTSIASVFSAKVNRIVVGSDDNVELTKLLTRVGRVQFIVLALVLSGLIFFGKAFITMWAGEEYISSYYIVLVLVVPVTVPMIQNIGIEVQRARNKHQFRSWLYLVIAICNIGISIPLCQQYGGLGCAIGTGISFVIGNGIIMNIYYHKVIGLNMIFFWKEIGSMLIGLILPIVAGVLLVKYMDIYNVVIFVLSGIIYVLIYIFSMWNMGINSYEKELFRRPVMKLLKKIGR